MVRLWRISPIAVMLFGLLSIHKQDTSKRDDALH